MSQQRVDQFLSNINSINKTNAREVLEDTYTDDVKFIDPVKTIHGLGNLTKYFEDMYENVTRCHFILGHTVANDEEHSLEWVMQLQHPKISSNREITIDGASFIRFNRGKICYHRDYYDLGAMVYEHLPVLGAIVKKVRHAI